MTSTPGFLLGGGDMGARMRAMDWSRTPLGQPEHWPQSLRTATSMVLNSKHAMFLAWGPELTFLYNDAYTSLMGSKHPSGLGQPFSAVWFEIWDELTPLVQAALAGEATGFVDLHLRLERHGYPEDTWFTFSYGPVIDESGKPGGMYCTTAETTAKVLAERSRENAEAALTAQLKTETERMHALFEQSTSFIALLRGPDHVFEMANAAYRRLVGGRDVVGKSVRTALPEVTQQGFVDLLDSVFRTGMPYAAKGAQVSLQTESEGDLETRVLDFAYQPMRSPAGEVIGIFVEGIDVTEHALTNERLRIAQQSGGIGAFEWFPDSGRVVASDQFRSLWGISSDAELTAGYLMSLIEPDDLDGAGPNRIQKDGNPLAYTEYRIRRPDNGEVRWLARQGEVMDTGGGGQRYLGVTFDVTERKRAEQALSRSEAAFRALVDSVPHHVWTASAEGQLDWFNPRVYHYTGAPEGSLDGDRWTAVVHPDDLPAAGLAWANSIATGEVYQVEFRLLSASGAYRWHLTRAVPSRDQTGAIVRWIGTNTDIHEHKTLAAELEERVAERTADLQATEEALRQSQKMEAVGQLTGGIAHDFNNLLQGITGSLDLIQRKISRGETGGLERFIDGAVTSANRAAALTHRLLAFSRRQPLEPRSVCVNDLVLPLDDLLRRTLGETIDLRLSLDDALWPTLCDPNQLESALLNLVINARDAMPDGGCVTVSTGNVVFDAACPPPAPDVELGDYVCLTVSDTGIGMPPDVIARAFDPFFTTKPTGQGTGLGLSMIYGFARQSGGHVGVESAVGEGATFRLYLPRIEGRAAQEPSPPDAGEAPSRTPGQGEVVLVVEDEPVVRALIVEVLAELGYEALEASDGPSGLAILQSDMRIDLLISDVGLPGLNGRQMADAARMTRADLKVLFMTGYAENAASASGFLDPGMGLIPKPFTMQSIAGRIREMMQG